MRKIDENRAQNYIKKHERYQKWLVFALCLSLLTGTATLYMLNKPATAMTEEALDNVGIVIPTADAEFEQELIQLTQENKEKQESGEVPAAVEGENAGNTSGDEIKADEVKDETAGDEAAKDEATSGESSDEENKEAELTDEEKAELEAKAKAEQEAKEAEEKLKNAETAELSENVALTVSYVDENGDALADEKEISLTDSIDFSSEAREIEGYTFKEASIDGAAITVITAKQDADEHKYYEVTLKSGEVVEIKENKTVVLTYVSDAFESAVSEISLTAKYVDNEGVELAESSEIKIIEEKDLKNEYSKSIDGYFYQGVFHEDKEIVKVAPVFGNDEEADDDQDDEAASTVISGYTLTYADGETVDITEDTDILFKYLKASQETEFKFQDNKVSITATVNQSGVFPEGIELRAVEVTAASEYNYDAYMEALNENADTIANEAGLESANEYTENNTLLYDIAFMFDGKEIQPSEGAVSISIKFNDNQLKDGLAVASEDEITVVHLPLKDEVKEAAEITSTVDATDITSSDIDVETLIQATAEVGESEIIEFSTENFSIFAVTAYQKHEQGEDTFETVLGDAVNFGIVANDLTIGESETNFAVKRAITTSHSGNDLTNPAEQTYMAGKVEGDFQIKGFKAYFITPSEYTANVTHQSGYEFLTFDTAYQRGDIDKIVYDMLTYTRAASDDLAKNRNDSNVYYYDEYGSKNTIIDTTKLSAGTYYVTMDSTRMDRLNEAGKLRIFKKADQTIVFNVTDSRDIKMFKYFVGTNESDMVDTDTLENNKAYSKTTQGIIWNFINTANVESKNSVAGVFIAGNPNAKWLNNGTSGGWLAFPVVEIGSGEWHNTYDQVQQISGTAQFQAYKLIDDEEATVSGFKFKLSVQEESGAWTDIQEVTNDKNTPHNIIFDTITYGGNKSYLGIKNYQYVNLTKVGDSKDFIYVIDETEGTADDEGNAYDPDTNHYFAKVTVTLLKQNNVTNSQYYHVSPPKYYTDYSCTEEIKDSDRPVFRNETKKGSVGIKLNKYLNGEDPGDQKFSFTVKALNYDGKSYTVLTKELQNDRRNITYDVAYTNKIMYSDCIYLAISENDVTESSTTKIKKDNDVIIVAINHPGKADQSIAYYKYDYENANHKAFIDGINSIGENQKKDKYYQNYINKYTTKHESNKIKEADKVAFYNEGTALLRIHKIVVNDYGSVFVRDDEYKALLSNVKFRITNNGSGNYIVFKGFTGSSSVKNGVTGTATEYDAQSHTPTGKTFKVYYNGNAQWSIENIPAGTYTVDEVADGLTFSYSESANSSTVLDGVNLSRVTKYTVTTDDEENGCMTYNVGGGNWRKLFSKNIPGLSDYPPTNVKVGGSTQTVQVCNYYSIPIGPIQVTKNFSGGEWTDAMNFTFEIEGIGFTAKTSEGTAIEIGAQPMPVGSNTVTINRNTTELVKKTDDAEITQNVVVENDDGTYTAIVKFAPIPFRFEGTYYYKITETDTGIPGVNYDEKEYFVKIEVSKKYTTFKKTHSYENNKHSVYVQVGDMSDHSLQEDFYYLGADVTYAADSNFSTVLAKCELKLDKEPDTKYYENNRLVAVYSQGSVYDVAFNNTLTGSLTVNKEWIDIEGKNNPGSHTSLSLDIWQRTVGSKEWKLYTGTSVVLSADNNWSQTVTGLPLQDDSGNAYEYSVKESDDYLATYAVSYTYGSNTYYAEDRSNIKVDGKTVKDTGYVMNTDSTGVNFGNVTITNRAVISNTIPSTGGIGTGQYVAIGALLMAIAFAGMMLFRRRKSF